jgi:predicted nuclease of restriction endonuclease-like (RecB) superfamily
VLPVTADTSPVSLTPVPSGYAEWLAELKLRIHGAQQRAALAVNRELVWLYWQIGRDILQRQAREGWGAKVIERLAHDLRVAFPDMKGFSRANLMSMRAFAEAWPDESFVQQAVGQLPWGHNLVLLARLKDPQQRLAYAQRAIEHGWSRNVLNIHIETRLLEREGQAVTNFEARLPAPGSDLARQTSRIPTFSISWASVGRPASASLKMRWSSTSPASCRSSARASPSSAAKCRWRSAATISSSTCSSITSSCGVTW